MTSILNFIPAGKTLRPVQLHVLTEIEANWDKYDVFVAPVSVGGGKSMIAMTVMAWLKSKEQRVSVITPQVMLQDQYITEYPEVPALKGRGRYSCHSTPGGSCADYNDSCESYCDGCPYLKAKEKVINSGGGVFNFHSYLFSQVGADVLLLDEAHTIFDVLSAYYTKYLYKSADKYTTINTIGDTLTFLESKVKTLKLLRADLEQAANMVELKKLNREIKNLQTIVKGVQNHPQEFFFEKSDDVYRGKTTERIRVQPLDLSNLSSILWPYNGKIILMSGTINNLDIQKLGLNMKRVLNIECASAIEPARRPVWYIPVANMSYKHQDTSIPIMAKYLLELINNHPKDKGLIHVPYQLAVKLRKYLNHDRLLWHDNITKDKVYQEFRNSTQPMVLVASGMSEGVDLPYEAGRWQAIVKIQYPSLADNLMQYFMNKEKSWYSWMTVRTLVQQTGRICRGPTDFGETFILDTSFELLYKFNRKLFPAYFSQALKRGLPKRGPHGK